VTLADAVVDASAAVRGLTIEGEAAELLARIADGASVGHAPALIVAEVSNALALAARTEQRSLDEALRMVERLVSSPLRLHPLAPLAPSAIELAATSLLSAYDSFYAVLAAALDLPLVTADRRLAEAVPGSVLVS
jgi:predicted nucleic acid-binding protein